MAFSRSPEVVSKVTNPTGRGVNARLRLFASGALLLAVATTGFAVVFGDTVPWESLFLLGALLVCAEHRDRLFGDETSASGSIVVAMAAIVVFSSGPWLAGPMLCAGLAGAYWPHLRSRAWSRIAVNAASMSLAAATSATIFHVAGSGAHELGVTAAAAGLAALLGFWVVNSLVLGIAVAAIQRRPLWGVFRGLIQSETELLPFAYAGFLIGYLFADASIWAGALSLLGTLGALDLLVMRRRIRGNRYLRFAAPGSLAFGSLAAVVWLGFAEGLPVGTSLAVLVIASLGAGFVARRSQEQFLLFAGLLAVIAASVTAETQAALFAPLAVGLVASIAPASRHRTTLSRLLLVGAAGVAAVAAAGTVASLPSDMHSSLLGSVLAGVVGSLAALGGWHAAIALTITLDIGVQALPSVVGVLLGDVLFVLVTGVCGALSGWIGTEWGVAGLATSLVVLLAIGWALIGRSERAEPTAEANLTDDDVLDVLRSAVLDIPASRLPG